LCSKANGDTQTPRRERRKSHRIISQLRCWIMGARSALYTQVRNISRGGLAVPGLVPFEEGEEVSVRVIGDDRRHDLVARSKVVWCKGLEEDTGVRGMGAEFVEITSGGRLLDRILGTEEEPTPSEW
jgi:Tfp pilus assembly protein PilZ